MKHGPLILALIALPVFGENDFDSLVRSMESQYGSKRMYIPMMGVANFFVKLTRPAGTSDLKIAVFEHVDSSRHPLPDELDETVMRKGWKPFVRVVSKRKHADRVQIYLRQLHRDHELLITTFEHHEAVMVRLRVNAERLARWVNNPVRMARSKRWHDSD